MPFTINDLNNILRPLKARRELKLNRGRAQQLADIFEEDQSLSDRDRARLRASFETDYSNVDDVNEMYGDILSGAEERAANRQTALDKSFYRRQENYRSGLPKLLEAFGGITAEDYKNDPGLVNQVQAAANEMGVDPNRVIQFLPEMRKMKKTLMDKRRRREQLGGNPLGDAWLNLIDDDGEERVFEQFERTGGISR